MPADASRETEVVANQGARGRLSADPALVDDQRAESLRGTVDRGREAARPGTDDDDVELAPLGIDRGTDGGRQLQVARVREGAAVREHHQRKPLPDLRDQLAAVGRVGEEERVRERAAPQDLPQLVGPAGPRLGDDLDGMRGGPPCVRPLEQKLETDWWNSSSGARDGRIT